ncbi:MAG: hypothetical protein VW268_14170 [Rhodospirillaceae bacterium]
MTRRVAGGLTGCLACAVVWLAVLPAAAYTMAEYEWRRANMRDH